MSTEKITRTSSRKVISGLMDSGWEFSRYRGSHAYFRKDGREVCVPKRQTLHVRQLTNIRRQCGMTIDEFNRMLKE